MPMTVALYKKLEEVEPQLRGVLFAILEEIEQQRDETVTKMEFTELTEIVRDLASAQKQTEKRMEELAAAQKQTEKRMAELEKRMEELAVAQTKTENKLDRLETVVGELVEAQRQMTNRLDRLEVVVSQIAGALKDLVKEHSKTRSQMNGLSTTIGFVLENEAYKFLPMLLKKEFGLDVKGKLVRKFVNDNKGDQIEVNIVGEARRNGDQVVIIGESKAQLSKNKVEEFLNKKLKRLAGVYKSELFPILITHMISQPDVEEFALQQGIKRVYYSYEFSS